MTDFISPEKVFKSAVSIAIFLNHYQREKQTNFRCVNNTLYEQFGTGDIWTKRGFMCESFGDQK